MDYYEEYRQVLTAKNPGKNTGEVIALHERIPAKEGNAGMSIRGNAHLLDTLCQQKFRKNQKPSFPVGAGKDVYLPIC